MKKTSTLVWIFIALCLSAVIAALSRKSGTARCATTCHWLRRSLMPLHIGVSVAPVMEEEARVFIHGHLDTFVKRDLLAFIRRES